jgi:hemolysin activation/secretion protein
VIRFNGIAELGLGDKLAVAISPRLQYGFDKLLSFEQFTAGNYTVGRGYDPSILTGDSGAGVSVELRGPRLTPFSRTRLQVQPYVFGDAAWTWTRGEFSDPKHLKSAGGGLRGELSDRAAIDAAIAIPLERTGMIERDRPGPRFLLTLTTRLLPWS